MNVTIKRLDGMVYATATHGDKSAVVFSGKECDVPVNDEDVARLVVSDWRAWKALQDAIGAKGGGRSGSAARAAAELHKGR